MNEMRSLEKQKSQSGQALVEYVLLLVIAVALILGLANQFYRPFGNWVQNQMGPYLECLLDVGELPAIGGDASGECASQFSPFSPGPNLANQVGGRSAASNSSNSGQASAKKKANDSSEDSDGSGGAYAGNTSNGRNNRNRGFPVGGVRGSDGAGNGSGNETIVEKLPESKYLQLKSAASAGYPLQQRVPVVGITGLLPAEKEKLKRQEEATFRAGGLESEEMGGKPKKLVLKPQERKIAIEQEGAPWSFGQYIKYAIILMIIIAIVLFLAGQVAQISKSSDK